MRTLFFFAAATLALVASPALSQESVHPQNQPPPAVNWPSPNVQTLPSPPSAALPPQLPIAKPPPKLAPKGRYQLPFLPPVQYDHPFDGILTVRRLSESDIVKVCDVRPVEYPTHLGCAFPGGRKPHCLIYIVNDDVLASYGQNAKALLRHETGHCNGWGADHAGARAPEMARR
jgi:hypothetical protein